MNITFCPESDTAAFVSAAREYQDIWDTNGRAYINALEAKTGLEMPDKPIEATIFEGVSRSHPLKLRASYSRDIKAPILIHELGHRLLIANELGGRRYKAHKDLHVISHKLLNLFLYDVYVTLFGDAKASEIVAYESNFHPSYRECWQWALELTETERAARFANIKAHRSDWLPYLDETP
mgnify:CR=1 FL=1